MATRSNRSRRTSVKALATASAAGFAIAAVASPAGAVESGNYKDPFGNLANTEQTYHCTAKLEAGTFPITLQADGTLRAEGTGTCNSGTTFDHGIVDIQELVNGNWVPVPGSAAVQFNAGTTNGPWTQAVTPNVANAPCKAYRARTRVWRRADAGKADPTIAVKDGGTYIGQGGFCAKL
jgi:hypothetical protein